MLTVVMMKVEGVTKEGGGQKDDDDDDDDGGDDGRCYEGGRGGQKGSKSSDWIGG